MNFVATRPLPLIPRYRVGEVSERILADGSVDTPLDREELRREARRLVEDEGAEALVVSFLNAFRTPEHEAEARKLLGETYPQVPLVCSHEVWPQIRSTSGPSWRSSPPTSGPGSCATSKRWSGTSRMPASGCPSTSPSRTAA